MNVLIIYCQHLAVNYNKLLIIDAFKINNKFLENNNINFEIIEIYDINNFIDNFDISKYKNYIFWLHQKVGSYLITFPEKLKLIKENNIKTIFWMDDLHFPTLNTSADERLQINLIDDDDRYKNVDLIISPSIDYFYNVNSILINKSRFLFYFFDERIINKFSPANFDMRINKILLTGKINELSYPSRKQMYTNYFYNKKLYDWLEHPGYNKLKHDLYHLKYYEKLSNYKGAILGLAKYPVNFLLAKVIEILGCGCLGFFEESPLYNQRLGLKEYIHYIPIKKIDNNELNLSYKKEPYFYLNLDNEKFKNLINSSRGKLIALNGYNHIKNNYNSQKFIEQVVDIFKEI